MNHARQKVQALPFHIYYRAVWVLALCGWADAVYLSISHYRVYVDMGYRSFCAITKSLNCDTVSQSPYSILMEMPVPIWGVIGYTFLLMLILLSGLRQARQQRMWSLITWIAFGFSVYSLVLAAISSFLIHSYCLMCIVSYAINFLVLFYSWLIHRRFADHGWFQSLILDVRYLVRIRRLSLSLLLPFTVVVFWVWAFFPAYWKLEPPSLQTDLPSGLTSEGDPWIGAVNPQLIITEFTDYRCFQCKKMHAYLRHILSRHPNKIRLIHKHFPMDHEFNPLVKTPMHIGSGRLALLSIYASTQGKFWEMNDYLFNMPRDEDAFNMVRIAKACGMDTKGLPQVLTAPGIIGKLMHDIRQGLKFGIDGTPGYVIGENVYTAQIPPEILMPYLE